MRTAPRTKGHRWTDGSGITSPKPGWLTKAEAKTVAAAIRKLTDRTYAPYRCPVCGIFHIRLLSRRSAAAAQEAA